MLLTVSRLLVPLIGYFREMDINHDYCTAMQNIAVFSLARSIDCGGVLKSFKTFASNTKNKQRMKLTDYTAI